MTRLGTCTCVYERDCMKPRFLFVLVCKIQVCVLLGRMRVFVFYTCVRLCVWPWGALAGLWVGGSGQGGPCKGLGAQLRRDAPSHGSAGVYCYRVNRRLFLVPSDPGTPCRLCRTPRDQKRPETLVAPAQVR